MDAVYRLILERMPGAPFSERSAVARQMILHYQDRDGGAKMRKLVHDFIRTNPDADHDALWDRWFFAPPPPR
jgi:hypothetical protein